MKDRIVSNAGMVNTGSAVVSHWRISCRNLLDSGRILYL